jgi:arylsulfatase A-like enzyme
MLAEIFRDRGYVTGGFVANLPYTSYESGLTRGFVRYDDYRVAPKQAVMHSWIAHTPLFLGIVKSRSVTDLVETLKHPDLNFEPDDFNERTYARKTAGEVNQEFLDWQAANAERPFFAFLNYFDAHVPYRPSPEFVGRFASPKRVNVGLYDGAIASIDHEVGRLFSELNTRGVLDKTIVIITSDHGEQFGEHGLRLHANSLYLPLLHVPLMVRYPARGTKGTRVDTPVTLRDLASTVIDLANLTGETSIPGSSLARLWDGSEDARPASEIVAEVEDVIRPSPDWPVSYGPMQSAFDDRFHYIRRGDGLEELYDYHADHAETQNLAATSEGQSALIRLRSVADRRKR